jgi:ABC-2 type transport system permease protein
VLALDRDTLVNNIISSILWGAFPFISILLLTAKTKTFYGWTRDELYLLTGCFIFFIGIFLTLFGRSFKRFAVLADFGYLDETLLKPVDSQFLISFWMINFVNLFRIVFGIVLMITMGIKLHVHVSPGSGILFAGSIIAGIFLLYSIWFITLTFTVWFPKLSNLRDLLITFNSITRYPPEVFQSLYFLLYLFFLPLTLIISIPAKALLVKESVIQTALLFILAAVLFVASRLFWKVALRSYTSAGG